MNINTINSSNKHVKLTLEKLASNKELPFMDVLSARSVSDKINKIDYRKRVFPPDMTVFAFLSQVIEADQSCQAAVARVMSYLTSKGKEMPSANTAAYCKARTRLPEHVLSELVKESGSDLEKQAKPEWLWRGRHLKIPDGTTVSMQDTLENQTEYPQTGSQKKRSWISHSASSWSIFVSDGSFIEFSNWSLHW